MAETKSELGEVIGRLFGETILATTVFNAAIINALLADGMIQPEWLRAWLRDRAKETADGEPTVLAQVAAAIQQGLKVETPGYCVRSRLNSRIQPFRVATEKRNRIGPRKK